MKFKLTDYSKKLLAIIFAFFYAHSVLGQSDVPCGAPALPVGTSCNLTLGDAAGATRAALSENVADATCGSYSNPLWVREDTWFTFVAPASGSVIIETFAPQPIAYQDDYPFAGAAIYSGTCGNLTQMICDYDNAQNNYPEFNLTNLTPGVTYYIRFWGNSSTIKPDKTYNICIWEPAPPPANDECFTAIPAAVNPNAYCTVQTSGTVSGATASTQSNWCGGTTNDDVWFSFVATNTTHYFNLNNIAGSSTALSYQVFSGTCGSLSNATCNSGVANNMTIGNTYYVRVWSTGSTFVNTTFDLCITVPPPLPPCATNPAAGNTACTATPICNLNGYCGTTSSTYSADYWPELGSAFCNATIENNSFLSFTAQATTVSFYVWVSNCNSPYGIQIMVFTAANCSSGPVVQYSCWNPGVISVAPVLVSVPGLTIGNEYFIMIDGNSGAVCDYTIGAHEGFELPVSITSENNLTSICLGESIELYAEGGTGNYTWTPATGLNTNTGATVVSTPLTAGTITYSVGSAIVNPICPTTTSNFTLTIGDVVYGSDTQVSCGAFTWIDANTYAASNNTATFTIAGGAASGCDSIVTLNLTVNNGAVYGTDTQVACGSYTWINGVNYTASNNTATFTIVGGSVAGCDSIVTLNLTISTDVNGTDIQTACNSYTWIDGNTYTTSNNIATFTIVGGSVSGCDSIVTLNLTINNSVNGIDNQTACNSYTWIDGNTYTANNSSATFTIVGGSVSGCDSIVTLNLTMNNVVTSTDVQTSCNSYTWMDGNTYTASNNTATFTIAGGSVSGCDSIITLNLTIISGAVQSTDNHVACNSYTWIDGNTYTTSNNTATFNIPGGSVTGCDSTITLNLTINNPVNSTDIQVACGSYTWIDGVNYTANNNSATFTIVGGAATGCDSIITLDLTIGNTVFGTDVQTACQPFTWIDGNTYSSNNSTATFTLIGGSVNGCDSIVTLNLTMGSPSSSTDFQIACDEFTWINGVNYTSSNNAAQFTIPGGSVGGCDSIISLDLIIFPSPIVNLGSDLSICENSVTIVTNGNYSSYLWNTGSNSPSITVSEEGNYSVFVTDINGCSGGDEVHVTNECEFSIWVPNAFTPDGDENNQTFKPIISGKEIDDYTLFIFNRWGEMIFESHNVEIGWDGTYDSKLANEGVYSWKIILKALPNADRIEYVGHVNLLK